ncbi:DUF397 domain-containing protein [Streptomyces sp. SGAir0957]
MTTNYGRHAHTAPELKGAVWKKSSYSGGNEGQCVEVAALTAAPFAGLHAVRDSKYPGGPALILSRHAMAAFVASVRTDRRDN